MVVFHHKDFPANTKRWGVLQDYMLRPYLIGMAVYACMLLVLIARHASVAWPGIIGIFLVAILGNFFGTTNAKAQFLEIGFAENYFYLRSAYDIAFQKNLRFYPLPYANATREGAMIYLNYIDHVIRLRQEGWERWYDIWLVLSGELETGNIA